MDPIVAHTTWESLHMAFHMSTMLETSLDHHTLFVLITLYHLNANPKAFDIVVKEMRKKRPSSLSFSLSSAPLSLL